MTDVDMIIGFLVVIAIGCVLSHAWGYRLGVRAGKRLAWRFGVSCPECGHRQPGNHAEGCPLRDYRLFVVS